MIKHEDGRNEASDVIKMLRSLQPDVLVGEEEGEINCKDGVLTVRASKRHTVANVIECIERMTEKLEKANGMLEWAHKEVLRLNIENSELHAKLATAERERDAAIRDLSQSECKFCKHTKISLDDEPCKSCRSFNYPYTIKKANYEWRGVCEENTREGRECSSAQTSMQKSTDTMPKP